MPRSSARRRALGEIVTKLTGTGIETSEINLSAEADSWAGLGENPTAVADTADSGVRRGSIGSSAEPIIAMGSLTGTVSSVAATILRRTPLEVASTSNLALSDITSNSHSPTL